MARALLSDCYQGSGFAPFDTDAVTIAPPTSIVELTGKTLRGEPNRLSWSPDGSSISSPRDGIGNAAHGISSCASDVTDCSPSGRTRLGCGWHNKVLEDRAGHAVAERSM